MVKKVVCAQSTNPHVLTVNGRTRSDGQGSRLCSVNKSSRTRCKRPNEVRWSRRSSTLIQQIVTSDRQGGCLCSVNKSSRTNCKQQNEARWSGRSCVLNQLQQIVTYSL